jgi:hypothetical protein
VNQAPTTTIQRVARRIMTCATAGRSAPEDVANAIETTFKQLEKVVSSMVGEIGFRALMVRALHLTRAASPKHRQLPSEHAVSFPSEGWKGSVEQTGASAAIESAAGLFENVLSLLGSFIGEDLTFRLIRRAWPDLDEGGTDPSSGEGLGS